MDQDKFPANGYCLQNGFSQVLIVFERICVSSITVLDA